MKKSLTLKTIASVFTFTLVLLIFGCSNETIPNTPPNAGIDGNGNDNDNSSGDDSVYIDGSYEDWTIEWKVLNLGDHGLNDPWMVLPSYLWNTPFPDLTTTSDLGISLPDGDLMNEDVGTIEKNVGGIFDRWTLNDEVWGERSDTPQYSDITEECAGKIEIDFALTPEDWSVVENRKNYYQNVNNLIDRVSAKMLTDFNINDNTQLRDYINNPDSPLEDDQRDELRQYLSITLTGEERENFLHALKTLVMTENGWQNYIRYKHNNDNWFFIILSGGTGNELDDWGNTQIARSTCGSDWVPLNDIFFDNNGHCSIYSTTYYGFSEYYFNYMQAREQSCNDGEALGNPYLKKIVGAYNRYVAGFSSCHDKISTYSVSEGDWERSALENFINNFINSPWLNRM